MKPEVVHVAVVLAGLERLGVPDRLVQPAFGLVGCRAAGAGGRSTSCPAGSRRTSASTPALRASTSRSACTSDRSPGASRSVCGPAFAQKRTHPRTTPCRFQARIGSLVSSPLKKSVRYARSFAAQPRAPYRGGRRTLPGYCTCSPHIGRPPPRTLDHWLGGDHVVRRRQHLLQPAAHAGHGSLEHDFAEFQADYVAGDIRLGFAQEDHTAASLGAFRSDRLAAGLQGRGQAGGDRIADRSIGADRRLQ